MKKLIGVLLVVAVVVLGFVAVEAGKAIGVPAVAEKVKVDAQEFLARPDMLVQAVKEAEKEAAAAVKASDDARAEAQAARDRADDAWFWARPALRREANRLTSEANAKTAEARQEVVMSAITTTTASSELGRWEAQAIWLGISFIAAFGVVFSILLSAVAALVRWIRLRLAPDAAEPVTPPTE